MAGNGNYNDVTSAAAAVTISKANQATLTVASPTAGTYGQFYDMSATGGTTSGAVSFNVVAGSTGCSIVATGPNQGKLEITNGSGICSITATMAGNDNYNNVNSAASAVTVSKANQAVVLLTRVRPPELTETN
jgi:hypothetical protein